MMFSNFCQTIKNGRQAVKCISVCTMDSKSELTKKKVNLGKNRKIAKKRTIVLLK